MPSVMLTLMDDCFSENQNDKLFRGAIDSFDPPSLISPPRNGDLSPTLTSGPLNRLTGPQKASTETQSMTTVTLIQYL